MSESLVNEGQSLDLLVGQVADEFLRRQQAGERPSPEEYAARHPQAAELLRKVLASLRALDAPLAAGPGPEAEGAVMGTLGDYRILREVGRGAQGVVYEAEQISLGRRVALKVLPFAATMDARQLQRFHNEARAAASLEHPHIVPVYAVGCERGVHFYAMKFIEGRTLAQVIADANAPSAEPTEPYAAGAAADTTRRPAATEAPRDAAYFRRVAEWGVQAAEALEHAHSMGIVHRDVKPGNLMIDGSGKLWVTDFGLARTAAEGNLTVTGDVLGTLRYMPPEQALARHGLVDHRADVYALGATHNELLTRSPAFPGDDRRELLRQIASDDPARPRRLNPSVPAELEVIVLKALEKDSHERYATAQELADDLRNWLEDRPLRARRPGPLARAQKWSRRHRAVVRAAGLGLVVAVVALAASTAWAWHKQKQTENARQYAEGQRVAAENNATEADKQRRRADENFRSSVKVVTGLLRHLEVARLDERRRTQPDSFALEHSRLSLASEAILVIQELLEGDLPDDPEGRLLTAQAYEGLGTAHVFLGEFDKGIRWSVRALETYKRLAAEFPGEARYADPVSRVSLTLTALRPYELAQQAAEKGLHEVAARGFRDTLRLEQDVGVKIDRETSLIDQSFCRVKLADALRALRQDQEAEQVYGQAVVSCDQLAKAPPERVYPVFVVALKARAQASRGLLRAGLGRLDQAETDLREALGLLDGLKPDEQQITLGIVHDRARIRSAFGNVLWSSGHPLEAAEQFRAAEKEWRQARSTPVRDNQLAWFLATCPDAQFRKAQEAVELARKAVKGVSEKEPWRVLGVIDRSPWDCRRTLGVALYRAGDWKGAAEALDTAADLSRRHDVPAVANVSGLFFQAMAGWKLGNKKRRDRFDAAVQVMKTDRPKDEELLRFREEAAQVLGIEEKKD